MNLTVRRTLNLYVISEILPPFFLGLLVFTSILLVARILKLVDLVVTRGVPMLQIGNIFVLVLPTFLEMTLPMAFLLAILLGLGRLSHDHEVLALKISGVSPLQILIPIGMAALLISSMTLMITTWARPQANLALKKELFNIAKSHVGTALKEKVFNDDFPGILIYVEELIPPGNTSQGVLIVDRRDRQTENVIMAKAAFFLTHEESQNLIFKLFDGTIHERNKHNTGFSQTHFNVYDFRLDLAEAFNFVEKKERGLDEMSLRRLNREIARKTEQGLNTTAELMEFHRRFSFPFAPLIFSLLGVSLAMIPTRSRANRSWGFTLCLFWLLIYYSLLSLGKALGEREILPPILALWLPNMVLGLISIHLFRKALKESPLVIQTKLAEIPQYWNRVFMLHRQKDPSR